MEITVVIPVYNVSAYLRKCVDSVIAQTFKDYEIILVDDGSTDNSGEICDEYANKYPFISVIHQENKGLGGARNTGIEAAKGKYIYFLDSDDYIHSELLEICYSKAEENNYDMVLFDAVAVYENGEQGVMYTCNPILPNVPILDDAIKPINFISSAWNRLYKYTLFKESNVRFPEKLWYEDLHTLPKLVPYIKSAYYYSEKPLYYYFQRSASIMHTPDFERLVKERIAVVNEVVRYYTENNLLEDYKSELEFICIYHGFFLPVREMQAKSYDFAKYADILREKLFERCEKPLNNKYNCILNKKEKMLLKWAVNRNYNLIKLFSFANKLIKRIRNVK